MATSQDQSLYSPYFLYSYVDDTICTWAIAAQRGYCVYSTIVSFCSETYNNLTVESEDHTPHIFTETNCTLPITLPLFSSPVYLRFTTDDSLVESGFHIVYREHPSPNFTSTQLFLPSKAESQTLSPPVNNTLFSIVLHQLDALITNNLLTTEQLEYVQSQLNDRLEDFSYQLASHVQTFSNSSCLAVTNNFTAYTPPFPFYEYIMLFPLSLSILFSIFFLLFTYCSSRRLYHLYLVPNKYRPGKYAHAFQYLLILPLISSSSAKPLSPNNLSLAIWRHVQWESNHGIFIPSLQYRSSEAFFEYMIFIFVLSTFCLVLYLLLFSKSGGRSPSPDSSMPCLTTAFHKRLSQTSLITLLPCSPNAKVSLAPLTNGVFTPLPVSIPDNWHYTPNATWEHISFDHPWERPHDDPAWKNPIPMYYKIFGYAITEGKTFSEKYFPGSRYWNNVTEMERTCLCERDIKDLHPSPNPDMLLISTPIVRNTGNMIQHRWKWALQPSPDQFHTAPPIPKQIAYPLLSIIKEITLSLLADYAVAQSNCSFRQKLVNCGVRSYACVYSEGTPPDTPIQCDDSKGSFWQNHFHKKSCTTSPNHRWMSVCKSTCTSTNIVSENLQWCDITKALWYGKNSGAYKSAYHSPCCPYDYSCYKLDIQHLWYRDTISCTIYGREMAFEPVPKDIVIQEEFDTIESLKQVQNFLKTWNKNYQIRMLARVKVIVPTTHQNSLNYRDGPITISDFHNQYLAYPSMTKGDKTCFQRVKNDPTCNNLVGGVLQKLAFFDHVHFDPAQNKPKIPNFPRPTIWIKRRNI